MKATKHIDLKLLRYLSFSPIIVALLVCVGGPALYFSLHYQYQHAEIEAISRIHASWVNEAINKNPTMWQFEEHKLRAMVEDRVHVDHEHGPSQRSIVLNDGSVLASNGGSLPAPLIQFDTALYDASNKVGVFRVTSSLYELLMHTLWVTLACVILALCIVYSLRTIPLRAIRKSYEQLSYLANNDTLTGLANRHCFMAQLELSIAQAQRSNTSLLLMYLDLDNFKHVNDSLGHHAGDTLLSTLGARLRAMTRRSDIAGRIGGDEFVLCFTQLDGDIKHINKLASAVRDKLIEPVDIAQRPLLITSSIGLAKFPEDGKTAAALLRAADTAMYDSKTSGKNDFRFYSEELSQQLQERLRIIADLPEAIANRALTLAFQPLVSASSGEMVGVEALVRWNHPKLGNIRPDRLINIAEETGDIIALGQWVLGEACRQNRAWQDAGHPAINMAVNVSAVQFTHPGFLNHIDEALQASGMAPEYLELEITESLIMADFDTAYEVMNAIQQRGIALSIDDFGTGYSSLNHLKRFPVSKLKIDRSFIIDLVESGEDQLITKIIIMLGKELNMQVVAEGVETEEQVAFLRSNACDIFQGFYFSRPVSAQEIFALPAPIRSEQA